MPQSLKLAKQYKEI